MNAKENADKAPQEKIAPDTSVGDAADSANDLRFDEEERLIREQSQRPETD